MGKRTRCPQCGKCAKRVVLIVGRSAFTRHMRYATPRHYECTNDECPTGKFGARWV